VTDDSTGRRTTGEDGGVPTASVPPQRYGTVRLLIDVCDLLTQRGLTPLIAAVDLPRAVDACAVVLACLGIEPDDSHVVPPSSRGGSR
jgi:hypothetical protein